jgi:long-chain acyl-CoA synthetase
MVTYAERPWLKYYDPNVPATLEPYPDIPLHSFLQDTARTKPNAVALITSLKLPLLGRVHSEMTYQELDTLSDALAAGLVDMGLKKGEPVAVIMPNCAAFVISFYAILKAGGVVVATNPTYPPGKMQFQISDSGARFAISLSLFYKTLKQIQPETSIQQVIVANIKEYFPWIGKTLFTLAREKKEGHRIESLADGDVWFQDVLAKHAGHKPGVDVTADDPCIFQYTGGTTGIPKAATSTHRALVANTLQMAAVLQPTDNEVFIGALPLFHVFGMVAVLSKAVYLGAKLALVINARDINDLVEIIDTYKPTLFHGVPALFNALNQHPKIQSGQVSMSSIRACVSGSAPLPPSTKRDFERLSGGKLLEGFGMSEAPTATHVNPLYGENRTGSIGLPFPDMDMRIVSLDDDETDVPVGEIGEMVMAGPQIMKGYHRMPDETAAALRERHGKVWLYTGDIARMDEDGYFYIVDRKKDMALIGGFNVYPSQVEKILKEHPAVNEVGVAAVPHPDKPGQEALKAWIVLKPEATVTEQELIEHCSRHLARYEIPSRFAFIDALPKSEVLKTLRYELVRMEMEEREKLLVQ